ncbi:MAG: S-methyl-5'-thioadenosine phosphorylase [Nitrospirae bacterium]|nr:S-methyl-5'-thioadenosine phosphorylase [Nitrospirota bacterium]
MPKIGVIAGSGIERLQSLRLLEEKPIKTPYGEPSGHYKICEVSGIQLAFLARHGIPHRIPPHKINYRANLWGFKSLGVQRLISVSAGGGINPSLRPGDIVLLSQVIDMTQGTRQSTFYDEEEVVHVDFTEPYCLELRTSVLEAGKKAGIPLIEKGTYICVNGPRLETAGEIRFFSSIGADVVGMTGMPEACLARELELCLSSITVITNYAAGISRKKLTAVDVIEKMKESNEKINALLSETFHLIPKGRGCSCKDALKDARV